jgi:hypothetical protein
MASIYILAGLQPACLPLRLLITMLVKLTLIARLLQIFLSRYRRLRSKVCG